MADSPKQRIDKLRDVLNQHNHNYYVLAKPTVSDQEYDRLMREHPAVLRKLLLNISLLLASRVRALSDELQAAKAAH